MIEIIDKKQCCGCGTCVEVCPAHAIVMKPDEEGFRYPIVDTSVCVSCNMCNRNCPFEYAAVLPQEPSKALLLIDNDARARNEASSGGAFGLLAADVIAKGGVVYGAAFDEDWNVRHIGVETLADLWRLKGSKYVESDLGDCYTKVIESLTAGRRVMFTGTPCQVAGLYKLLGRYNPALLLVEVACHGVPSPSVWRQALDEYCEKENISRRDITAINFRDKVRGWKNYHFTLSHRHGSYSTREFPFVLGFAYDLYQRPSCYACRIKDYSSCADLTIADAWGVEHVTSEERFLDDKGVSLVLTHSPKGRIAVNSITSAVKMPVAIDTMLHYNSSITTSAVNTKERERFFSLLNQGNSVAYSITKAHRISYVKRLEKLLTPLLVRLGIKGFTKKWRRK